MIDDISQIRQEYTKNTLDEKSIASSPFKQFEVWFQQTVNSNLFYDPTSFALSTCGNDKKPHSRIVLLKSYDENGFQFFTNYNSTKGKNIEENPNVSMLFFWDKLERQVRIDGIASKISAKDSDEYFNSRPYESRIGAIASNQSEKLNSHTLLEQKITQLKSEFPTNPPRPDNWGGYIIKPNYFEF